MIGSYRSFFSSAAFGSWSPVAEMPKKWLSPGLLLAITVIATTVAGVAFPDSSLESSVENSLPTSPFPDSADAYRVLAMTSDTGLPEEEPEADRARGVNHPGPENLGFEMPSDRIVFPTVHSVDDDAALTSSGTFNLVNGIEMENEEQGRDVFAPKEVVVIAICVVLLSLVIVVLAVVMTFLIRRRTRRKAYLRVKHASQTELAVHYVQNTPASAAARDAAMEQLFQSLASIDPDVQTKDYCPMNCSAADDRCLSPTESIASVDFGGSGKGKACSRSMPSLKNLNAHEEALNCTVAAGLLHHENSGRFKGRSRSFTERAALGVDAVGRAKVASRSHSEKLKNRVLLPTAAAGKRFEKKKSNKANRRSAPSFFRLAKFGLLRTQSKRQKAADAETEDAGAQLPCVSQPSEAAVAVCFDSKPDSNSLLDFEMPNVSPIFNDIGPMLTALHHHHHHHHPNHHRHQSRTSQLSVHSSSNTQLGNNNDNDMRTSHTSMQSATDSSSNRPELCGDNNNRANHSRVSLQSGYIQNGKAHRSSDLTIYVDAVSEVDAPGGQKVPGLEEVRDENLLCRSRQKLGNSAIETARKSFSSVGHLHASCKDVSFDNHNKQTIS